MTPVCWVLLFTFVPLQDPTLEAIRDAVDRGDFARTEQLSAAFTRLQPDDPLGWFYLGHARAAQGRFEEAVAPYEAAVEKGLDVYEAYYQLGVSAHRAGRFDVAERALLRALEKTVEAPDALYLLGVTRFERGRFAGAVATFTRLLEQMTPWTDLARFHRGMARRELGQRDAAKEDLRWVAVHGESEDLRVRAREMLSETPPRSSASSERRRWRGVLFEKGGYDSNVLRLSDTSLSQGTGESDYYLMSFARGTFDVLDSDLLSLHLGLLDLSYFENEELSVDAILFEATSEAPLGGDWALESAVQGDYYALDRDSLFRSAGFRLGGRRRLSEGMSVSGSGNVLGKRFQDDVFEDLDATVIGATLEVRSERAVSWLDLSGELTVEEEDAREDDRSFLEFGGNSQVRARLDTRWEARLEGWAATRRYEGQDRVLLGTRSDLLGGLRATVSVKLFDSLRLFLEGEVERNDSTLSEFDYIRRGIGLGLLVAF